MSHGPAARSWELLSAYIDEDLDDSAMAAVDRELRRDSGMADDLLALRRQEDALRNWAESVSDRPVPSAVHALLRSARASGDGTPKIGCARPSAGSGLSSNSSPAPNSCPVVNFRALHGVSWAGC